MLNEKKKTSAAFWFIAVSIYLAYIAFGLGENIKGTTIPLLQGEFSMSPSAVSLLLATNSLAYLLACGFTGPLAQKIGGKLTIAISLFFMTVSGVLISVSQNVPTLIGSFFVTNLGNGMLEIALGLLASRVFIRHTGTMLNIAHGFYGLASTLAPLLAVQLIGTEVGGVTLGWRGTYFLVLLFCIIPLVLLSVGKQGKAAAPSSQEKIPLKQILRDPSIWMLSGILIFGCAAELTSAGWLVNFLEKAHSFTNAEASWMLTLFFASFTISRLFAGPLIEKIGLLKAIAIFMTGAAVFILLGVLLGGKALVLVALAGFGIGPVYPTTMAVITERYSENLEIVMSTVLTIVGIGGMISNGIIGVVIDAFTAIFSGSVQLGYSAGYLLNVLFSVLTVLTALCLMHRFAKEKKKC